MKKSSKICAGLLIGGVLATGGMLVGCTTQAPTDNSVFANTTDVYGFAGATTGILANGMDAVGSQMLALSSISKMDESLPGLENLKTQLNTAISSTLDKYMNVFDSVVGGENPVNVVDSVSDKNEFKHKLTITASSIDGETTTCTLYFNENLLDDAEVEVDDSDDEEKETVLEGELYVGSSTTPLYVSGKKEIDPEDNEMEITFEARINKNDDTHKVVFSQEREIKNNKIEEEYNFEIVMGNYSAEFSFELEKNANGKIEVEYEQTIGGTTISFEIEKETDNSITISTEDFFGIELEINVSVVEESEQFRYVYKIPAFGADFQINGALR